LIFNSPCLAQTLLGGVQHEEQLPPVPKSSKFSPSESNNEWFRVPAWFAGNWKVLDSVEINQYDERTRQQDSNPHYLPRETKLLRFGWLHDRNADVWHCALSTQSEPGADTEVFVTNLIRPIEFKDEKAVLRSLTTVRKVRKKDNAVLSTERSEHITTYSQLEAGLMSAVSDTKSFDEGGLPMKRTKCAQLLKLESTFEPREMDGLRDMRALFSRYLQTNGLMSLLPLKEKNESK
jgi:hypothetical protein